MYEHHHTPFLSTEVSHEPSMRSTGTNDLQSAHMEAYAGLSAEGYSGTISSNSNVHGHEISASELSTESSHKTIYNTRKRWNSQ